MDYETVNTGEEEPVEDGAGIGDEAEEENDARIEAETPQERKAREEREERERKLRAKRRRLIPPFVMLSAGAVTSITMRILHYETKTMLIILLCVLVGFYMAGDVIRYMLDKFEEQIEEANMAEGEVIEKDLAEEDGAQRRA